jgi:RNA polymerase sigma-70 factor (ECF subfamily)
VKAPGVEPDESGERADPQPSATPSSLLDRLRTPDDEAAWERLLAMYGPTVERWCRQAGLSPEDAADVRQEVFRTVARGIAAFRRDRPGDSFRGWLYTTTRTRVIDFRRRADRQPRAEGGTDANDRLMELPAEESLGSAVSNADVRAVYERCVGLIRSEFEERTWRAFWGVAVDDRSAAEVAAELGMSPGAVYIAKSRILRRLREEFADLL